MKRPAYQFYPDDEEAEGWLKTVSVGAYGLWKRMMNLMHTGEPYGHLTAGSVPVTVEDLSYTIRQPLPATKRLLAELEERGVFSRTATGVIYSRRMVNDEKVREERAKAGASGGAKPKQTWKQNPSKTKANGQANTEAKTGSISYRLSSVPPSGEEGLTGPLLPEGSSKPQANGLRISAFCEHCPGVLVNGFWEHVAGCRAEVSLSA